VGLPVLSAAAGRGVLGGTWCSFPNGTVDQGQESGTGLALVILEVSYATKQNHTLLSFLKIKELLCTECVQYNNKTELVLTRL
jgi:hypothetical protein